MKALGFFLVWFVFSSSIANAKQLIVKYQYGNQIFGSTLNIYDDGTIDHGERTCCPPHTDKIVETDLTPGKLSDLKGWIQDAFNGLITQSAGHPTAEGSESGSLTVFQADMEMGVHIIERGNGQKPMDIVRKNHSEGAGRIEDLVNSYVKNRMYQ